MTDLHKAYALGVEFHEFRGCWSWTWGLRSSGDQYCRVFASPAEAAAHFLTTREARRAEDYAEQKKSDRS